MDFAELGTKADGAYWVRNVKTAEGAELGTIDAFSAGIGRADDVPGEPQNSVGALTGGVIPAPRLRAPTDRGRAGREAAEGGRAHHRRHRRREGHGATSKQAKLSCDPDITYTGAEQLILKLAGCPGPTRSSCCPPP